MSDRGTVLLHMRSVRFKMCDSHGEVRCTTLAVTTAQRFGHPEWLDDDTHYVWELALQVHDEHNLACKKLLR